MNVRVEAGPLAIKVVAAISEPVVSTKVGMYSDGFAVLSWTCFTLAPLSINGHSLNAVNPDFIEAGELTTSILA